MVGNVLVGQKQVRDKENSELSQILGSCRWFKHQVICENNSKYKNNGVVVATEN